MRLIITNPNQVGQIVRARRKARRVSQRQLAAKLDLSQNRLSEIESGVAPLSLERLITLANLLGLQIVLQDKVDEPESAGEW